MPERLLIAVVAVVLTALAAALVAGHGPWAGTTLATLGDHHGLNSGDLPVLAAWVAGLGACVMLWRRR